MVSNSTKELINDPRWVQRMEKYFSFIDKNSIGNISIVEIQNWATNMETFCKPTPNKMVKLRAQLYTFWGNIGLKPNILMTKEAFVENVNRLGMEEIKRRKHGLPTLLENCNNAWFDVVDMNDDGRLQLHELEGVMKATGMNPQGASAWLKHLSREDDGCIHRSEFVESEHNFWYKAKGLKWRNEKEGKSIHKMI